jgi:hypothetical protein
MNDETVRVLDRKLWTLPRRCRAGKKDHPDASTPELLAHAVQAVMKNEEAVSSGATARERKAEP